MADNYTLSFYDARHKASSMTINVAELTSANFDGVNTATENLRVAVNAITKSTHSRQVLTTSATVGVPANDAGQRGSKAIIRWHSPTENDGEGAYGSNEVGCVDDALFTAVGDKLLLQGTEYTNLKTAFDAVALTENGNAVEVYEVEFVNRNVN